MLPWLDIAERGYHGTSMKDIAAALELSAASLYNHVSAKQEILRDVMCETMTSLIKIVRSAIDGTTDTTEQLRRAAEAHVRFHARHPREVRVGNHEIAALEEPHHGMVTGRRREYSNMFVALITRGVEEGAFQTRSPLLAAYAILQMGIGVSMWYRPGGALSEDDIVFQYGDIALGVVYGPRTSRPAPKRRAPKPK
jgi:AcrR family transcriptional regulator